MADASALGIHPPNTVRIDLDGWVQDWPFEQVQIGGEEILITMPRPEQGRTIIYYRYEHARACCAAHATGRFFPPPNHPPAWTFHGRESFTVTAGPPQPVSTN